MEIQLIIEGLECLTTKQHKCVGCSFNPIPGRAWPYGCGKGQGVMVKAAKAHLELLRPMAPMLVREGWNREHNNYRCYVNGMGISRLRALIDEATAVLRAEAHVMTLEEIKALPDYVFLEDRDISHAFSIKTISRPALPQLVFVNISGEECVGFRGPDGDTSLVTSRYGVEWRCWTSRPTDAQREAEPWK